MDEDKAFNDALINYHASEQRFHAISAWLQRQLQKGETLKSLIAHVRECGADKREAAKVIRGIRDTYHEVKRREPEMRFLGMMAQRNEKRERAKIAWTESKGKAARYILEKMKPEKGKVADACRKFAATYVMVDARTGKRSQFDAAGLRRKIDKIEKKR